MRKSNDATNLYYTQSYAGGSWTVVIMQRRERGAPTRVKSYSLQLCIRPVTSSRYASLSDTTDETDFQMFSSISN